MKHLIGELSVVLVKLASGPDVDVRDIEQVRMILRDIYVTNRDDELRIAILKAWATQPNTFHDEIAGALFDESLQIRIKAIRACSPVVRFRHELNRLFVAGEPLTRETIVEMWGSDPNSFEKVLLEAEKDPHLAMQVVRIWGINPSEFNIHLKRLIGYTSIDVRLAVLAAWSFHPRYNSVELRTAYETDNDQRVRAAIFAIWQTDEEYFEQDIERAKRLSKQNSTP